MKVSTVSEMRNLDRRAMDEFAVPELLLMENAGQAVYFVIHRELGVHGRRFVVLCGLGNNGGDGLVVARKIHSTGGQVRVFVLGDPARYAETPRSNYEMLCRAGVEIAVQPKARAVAVALADCDAVVDGLLGTGIAREVGGRFREIVELVNQAKKTVFSIDIPSGVDGNTGQIRGVAVRADHTVTFGLPKRGNLLQPGAALQGRLWVSHISFPPALLESADIRVCLNVPPPLPARSGQGPQDPEARGERLASEIRLLHPGNIPDDPIDHVQRLAREEKRLVLLTGAPALIGLPDGRVVINTSGSSGKVTDEAGDLLLGTIYAVREQGLPLEEAARAGVFLFGLAGELAARDQGGDRVTAHDILTQLPQAEKRYRADHARLTRSYNNLLKVI